ncbi:MAG TPA: hypothetical protein VE422_09455 [Terriglobia bacterium]|nr:hypothetical protein [Terriglobia bacterium]
MHRRFSACLAVGAMLFALVSAPLFHVHDHDDDHAESFIHAHFPEPENVGHAEHAIEAQHPQEHGRWIDLFAVNTPVSANYHAVAELVEPFSLASPVVTRAIISVQVLRAHSPPERSNLPSRSPPIL